MGRKKKTVLYKYKNKSGDEATGSISPKKARQVESIKEYAIKKAKRPGVLKQDERID